MKRRRFPTYWLLLSFLILWNGTLAYSASVTFTNEQKVSTGEAIQVQPRIICNQQGNIYLAWLENTGSRDRIVVNSSSDRSINWWPAAVTIHSQGAKVSPTANFQICADNAGHLYGVWVDLRHGSRGEIYLNYSEDHGKTWQSDDIKISTGLPGVSNPQIACTPNGEVYVVWIDSRSGAQGEVYFNRSVNFGKTWMAEDRRLDSALNQTANCASVRIFCSDNLVYVAWIEQGTDNPGIYYNYSTNKGQTFQPQNIQLVPGGSISELEGIWGVTGNKPSLVWIQDGNKVYFKNMANTSSSPVQLNGNSSAPVRDVRLAGDSDGDVYAIWLDKRTSSVDHVYGNYFRNGGSSWGSSSGARIDTSYSSSACYQPSISCSNQNNQKLVAVSWSQLRSSSQGLNTYVAYSQSWPPTGAINLRNNGTSASSLYSSLCCNNDKGDIYAIWLETVERSAYINSFINTDAKLEWTGETNYSDDGVEPNSAAGGSDFSFRVKYKNSLDMAPSIRQVWVDEDDNGTYESNEKYDMTALSQNYDRGCTYVMQMPLRYSPGSSDHAHRYRFYFTAGGNIATGKPAIDHSLTISNPGSIPQLSWVGTPGYTTDGVEPNEDTPGTERVFQVKLTSQYASQDVQVQVWIDADDNGVYENLEKYPMNLMEDSNQVYEFSMPLEYAGDGRLLYRFFACDLISYASGAPATNQTLKVNRAPVLCWADEDGYEHQTGENVFTFKVVYSDQDDDPPSVHQIWVDLNKDGDAQEEEKYPLDPNDTSTDYSAGRLYIARNVYLLYGGHATVPIRFDFQDGSAEAESGSCPSGLSPLGQSIPLQQYGHPPVLSWTGDDEEYQDDGVKFDTSPDGEGYTLSFRIKYTDFDGDRPGDRGVWNDPGYEVWIDLNDNGIYDTSERFLMDEEESHQSGSTYTALYSRSIYHVLPPQDRKLSYRFYFHDGKNLAAGEGSGVQNYVNFNQATLQWMTNPATATLNQPVTFRVRYVSLDNEMPTQQKVWLDINDNRLMEENEKLSMDEVDYGDMNCTNGKEYKRDYRFTFAGDGELQYRFLFSNSQGKVLGTPEQIHTIAIETSLLAPTLSWTPGYTKGVKPNQGYSGESFTFQVKYDDPDPSLYCPSKRQYQLWIDMNNNGEYEATERLDPNNPDSGSGIYTYYTVLNSEEGGALSYRFVFNNCYSTAIGEPAEDRTLTLWPKPELSWLGSEGYHEDGVDPNTGSTKAQFTFKVKYKDSRNVAPTLAQLWIDLDQNNYIADEEKYSLQEVAGGSYADGKVYQGAVTFSSKTDGSFTDCYHYRFVFQNGKTEAIGDPAGDNCLRITPDQLPRLVAGSVTPNPGNGGSSFQFQITYKDADNEAPSTGGTLWLDLNRDNLRQESEKWPLQEKDPNQKDYEEGKDYQASRQVFFDPNLSSGTTNEIAYQFYFSDANTSSAHVRVTRVGNVPELTYGIIPETGTADSYFTFQVIYSDQDGDMPLAYQIWVDLNGDGDYDDLNERNSMSQESSTDTNCKDGKTYTRTLYLANVEESVICYRFYFHDGKNLAKGAPAHDRILSVNHEPFLTSPEVSPARGAGGTEFTFRVIYHDGDNNPPLSYDVLIDENGNGTYELNEHHALYQKDLQKEFKDGVTYELVLPILYAGDAPVKYQFSFSDGHSTVKSPEALLWVTRVGTLPILQWVNADGYRQDGVDPNSSLSDANFSFKVWYQDADYQTGDPLPKVELIIERNTDRINTVMERYSLSTTSTSTSSIISGRIYSSTQRFSRAGGDGVFTYRFFATDGKNLATGTPTAGGKFYIDRAPVLSPPDTGDLITLIDVDKWLYRFEVKYSDADADPPVENVCWIDVNGDGQYGSTEAFLMSPKEENPDYSNPDGVTFTLEKSLSCQGSGTLKYKMAFKDKGAAATGNPTEDHTVKVVNRYYRDNDGDGYGNPTIIKEQCSKPAGYVAYATKEAFDTDDNDRYTYPEAPEICDGKDNDGNGLIDDNPPDGKTYYEDADGDRYGNRYSSRKFCQGENPANYVISSTDCDDNNPLIYPGATESCDNVDNNCDGVVDNSTTKKYYHDKDNDGYGDPSDYSWKNLCDDRPNYVENSQDCNDNDSGIHPNVPEIHCNGVDDDCDPNTPDNNSPQIAYIPSQVVRVGQTLTLHPQASDQDNDSVTYRYTGWMSSSSITPDPNDIGTHWVTVTAQDSCSNTSLDDNRSSQKVLVTVVGSGTIQGKITSTEDGNPAIDTALVQVQGMPDSSDTSDTQGDYSISDLSPGQYRLVVTASGYQQKLSEKITLSSGQMVTYNIQLSPGIGTVTGKVVEIQGNTENPLPKSRRLTVVATSITEGLSPIAVQTDPNGKYVLDLPKGTFKLAAFDPNSQFLPVVETNSGKGFTVDPNHSPDLKSHAQLKLKVTANPDWPDLPPALKITSVEKWDRTDPDHPELVTILFFYPQDSFFHPGESVPQIELHINVDDTDPDMIGSGVVDDQALWVDDQVQYHIPGHYEARFDQYYGQADPAVGRVAIRCTVLYAFSRSQEFHYSFIVHPWEDRDTTAQFLTSRIETKTTMVEGGTLGPLGFIETADSSNRIFDCSRVNIPSYGLYPVEADANREIRTLRVCLDRMPPRSAADRIVSYIYDLRMLEPLTTVGSQDTAASWAQVNPDNPLTVSIQLDMDRLLSYYDPNKNPLAFDPNNGSPSLDDLEVRYQDANTLEWKVDGIDNLRMEGDMNHMLAVAFSLVHNSRMAVFHISPSSLLAVPLSGEMIQLYWRDNALSEAGFEVQRRNKGSRDFIPLIRLEPNTTSYIDSTGLMPKSTYEYRVCAVSVRDGRSSFSKPVEVTTLNPSKPTPGDSSGAGTCFLSAIKRFLFGDQGKWWMW